MAAIWHKAFLETLAATGNVTASAASVDKTRAAAYAARKKSKRFREQWDEALEQAIDNLELEARRRALTGTKKPVFYKGKQVGIIREYSDNLAMFLLKAHRPEKYRDNYTVRHEGEIEIEVAATVDEAILAKLEAMASAVKSEGETDG